MLRIKQIIFFTLYLWTLLCAQPPPGVQYITNSEGLQNNAIFDILQDSRGFLWIASDKGLYKYDGYKFKVYKADPNDPYSISNNNLTSLLETHHEGNDLLWIGTDGGGLNKLDLDTERFDSYKFDTKDSNSLSNNRVEVIYEDKNGVLWIGTKGGGLNKLKFMDCCV